MSYTASPDRYDRMEYRRAGYSGLKLPAVSLGLWHNFGANDNFDEMRSMCRTAFDLGITHFDLANNYGPPIGSAEESFGRILKGDFAAHRDDIIISTKAGHHMWEGPYGDWGSRKYLLASLDQSLKRMGIPYVDIFYHHRPDPDTPMEESLGALDTAVKSGRALYAGLSRYNGEQLIEAIRILTELKCPFVINQVAYSIFDRHIEHDGLLETAKRTQKGVIVYSPLAQGLLTNRYLSGMPEDSRAVKSGVFLNPGAVTPERVAQAQALNEIAANRGQTLAQMALSWVLAKDGITSVIIGASRTAQIQENVEAFRRTDFTAEELAAIDCIAGV